MSVPPFRLCCGTAHWGARCPDGRVMCSLCYGSFQVKALNPAADPDYPGQREDVCVWCADDEAAQLTARGLA